MVTCVVCKDELSEDDGIPVSGLNVQRDQTNTVPNGTIPTGGLASARPDNNLAHPGCVGFPADLDKGQFKRWVVQSLAQQREAITSIRRSLHRIENALLALPEDMTATFRDELGHERRTYGDWE